MKENTRTAASETLARAYEAYDRACEAYARAGVALDRTREAFYRAHKEYNTTAPRRVRDVR